MSEKPSNCRNRQRDEGKMYPKSGCDHCGNGGLMGCPFERANTAPPSAAPVAQEGAADVTRHWPDCSWVLYEHEAPCDCNPLTAKLREARGTIATLRAQLAERSEAVIAQAGSVRALADALKTLTQAARISGGVAGADSNLMAACDKAENALSLTGVGCAVNAVLDVLEERDRLAEKLAASESRVASYDASLLALADVSQTCVTQRDELIGIRGERDRYRAAVMHFDDKVRELECALEQYGRHDITCPVYQDPCSECECGFKAALSQPGKGE